TSKTPAPPPSELRLLLQASSGRPRILVPVTGARSGPGAGHRSIDAGRASTVSRDIIREAVSSSCAPEQHFRGGDVARIIDVDRSGDRNPGQGIAALEQASKKCPK